MWQAGQFTIPDVRTLGSRSLETVVFGIVHVCALARLATGSGKLDDNQLGC